MKLVKFFIPLIAIFITIGCGTDDNSDSTMTALLAANTSNTSYALTVTSDAVSQLSDIFAAVASGERSEAQSSQNAGALNFYPGTDEVSTTNYAILKNPDATVQDIYDSLGPGTYRYTNTSGDECDLVLGTKEGSLVPVTLIIYPASSISVNYSYEKIMVKYGANGWDPVDSNGDIDFTARDPYYTQYFDGRRENITVTSVGNGVLNDTSLNLKLYEDINTYAAWDTADSNDYYSLSDFTFTYHGKKYGEGHRAYCEDKDGSGNITSAYTKEYSSRGFEILWGLFSKKQVESYFSIYDSSNKKTTQYGIIDIGKGLLWFLDKDEQYIGKSVKDYFTNNKLKYDARYAYYKKGFLGFNTYGYKVIELDGTTTCMSGTVKIYKKCRKPNSNIFDMLPYNDDYANLDANDFVLSNSQVSSLFNNVCTWNVNSVVVGSQSAVANAPAPKDGEYVITTDSLLIPVSEDEFKELSAIVIYNNNTRNFSITIMDGSTVIVSISNAAVRGDVVEGIASINGATYDIKLPLAGSGGVYKPTGTGTYSEI